MVGAVFARQSVCRLFFGVSVAAVLVGASSAQDADDKLAEYSALLQEIENKQMSIAYQRSQLQSQESEMASLQSQIDAVPALKEAVGPILQNMSGEIDKQISADLPFKLTERYDRLAAFQEAIAEGSEASVGEQMRRALNIYGIEVGYGSNVEAYAGNHPKEENAGGRYAACEADTASAACGLDDDQAELIEKDRPLEELKPGLLDGDYLRYGRLALVYLQHDGTEAYRYDPNSKDWEELSGNQLLEMRRAVRMAKGESAPAVINAPIYVR